MLIGNLGLCAEKKASVMLFQLGRFSRPVLLTNVGLITCNYAYRHRTDEERNGRVGGWARGSWALAFLILGCCMMVVWWFGGCVWLLIGCWCCVHFVSCLSVLFCPVSDPTLSLLIHSAQYYCCSFEKDCIVLFQVARL